MQDDGSALLRMPDIELLGIIRVMYETTAKKTTNRNFDSQLGMQQIVKIEK